MTGRGTTEQELALRDRLFGDVYDRSEFHRGRLDRAGLGREGIRHLEDLVRLPAMSIEDIGSPSDLLLAGGSGGSLRNNRRYWPLQWVRSGGVPFAYSADDLAQLGALGRDLFEAAGVDQSDVLVNVLPSGASRDYWQLVLGAQMGGLSSYACGAGRNLDEIEELSPTVIAGEARELIRLFDAVVEHDKTSLDRVHTLVVVGREPPARHWRKLLDAMDGDESAIVRAWAPDGVLALWVQCRGGNGFHTWPGFEILEVVDPISGLPAPAGTPGHIVWTGTGWFASAVIRLKTDVAVVVDDRMCPSCGRTSPRVTTVGSAAGFPAVLNANANISTWVAELQRSSAHDELVIWLALKHPESSIDVLAEIDAKIGSAHVIVTSPEDVKQRLENAKGERFGDRRAMSGLFAEGATADGAMNGDTDS